MMYSEGLAPSVFRDTMYRWRTRSLFYEMSDPIRRETLPPIYTLHDEPIERDGKVYPSLKKLYMQYDHAPHNEYEFATECLGGWDHWLALTNTSRKDMREVFEAWRQEIEVKHKAMAIKQMIASAKNDGVKGFSAAKYLADKGYASIRGRPSKDEVEKERKIAAAISNELEEDITRIGLSIVRSA